ncbi:MAG: PfkB family carbohydrate kinase [Solirubrobacteraceae bacterium]
MSDRAGGPPAVRVAVVGHVELVEFVSVPRLPAAGEVIHGDREFERPAGGGGVAAGLLAEAGATVELFTAFGNDAAGRTSVEQLQGAGVQVFAAVRPNQPTRRGFTLLAAGERSIITIGERLAPSGDDRLPWERLEACAGVYFTAGDTGALERARRARVLVATPRAGAVLESGPTLDALVFSAGDTYEASLAERSGSRARLVFATEGADGGRWWGESSGRWQAEPVPGTVRDAYGCGDTFAAILALALGAGQTIERATSLAATWAARVLTRTGAP